MGLASSNPGINIIVFFMILSILMLSDQDSFAYQSKEKVKGDTEPSEAFITNPPYPITITGNNITLKGNASDPSGIRAISASAHTFPFNGSAPIEPLTPPSIRQQENWTEWETHFIFNTTGAYRVVVAVRDNSDNVNYAETTVNVVNPEKGSRGEGALRSPVIAFVRSTFTEAAYQDNGFYTFYFKYKFPPFGINITTDLDMFTVKALPTATENQNESQLMSLTNLTSLIPSDGDQRAFWMPLIDNINKTEPNAITTVIRDEDVHDGNIFYSNGSNIFNLLIMLHNEYATKNEYDNLRQFVKNGGTIVFLDSNILFAEVRYDKQSQTVTLVKGHDWEFDGEVARRSVSERWYDENKEWVGGNFLVTDKSTKINFTNNPFNYTHFEEQYVNNPRAEIMFDYGIRFPKDYLELNELPKDKNLDEIKIATYELKVGLGKVIMVGLYGQHLVENEKFMIFFNDIIMKKALCPTFNLCP